MLRKHDSLILIVSIFVLLLIVRFIFYFSAESKFQINSRVEITHTFLSIPFHSDFQQYFYLDDTMVTLPLYPKYGYGDKIIIKGTVSETISSGDDGLIKRLVIKNPEVKMIESKELAVLQFIRQKVLFVYKSVLPPREAGLIAGIVLGAEDGINSEFKDELKRSGMLHVVVASGSNIVLVAGIIFSLIGGLVKKRIAIVFTIIGIFFYALLTGFDPPIVRASIMATFAFGAMLVGRPRVAFISLLFSGWLILMISPKLISDIGFQLSFSATLGIILFQKTIHLIVRVIPKIIKEDLATTIAAQIGAMPFLLIAFGEVNLLSIFINVLLLWTVPIIMIFGLLGAVVGLVLPILSQPAVLLVYPFLMFFSEAVRYSSNFYVPLSLTSIFFPLVVIYYIMMLWFLVKFRSKR